MKKHHFIIKHIEDGYGIFLRTMQERPLATFPTKDAAQTRLNQYLKKRKGELKMKTFIKHIKEWFVWLTSKKVGEAINNGASYNEVKQMVNDIIEKEN